MKGRRIPFRALWLWELYAVLVYAVLLFFIYTFLVPFTWLWILLVSLFGGGYLLAALVYFPLLYLGTRYFISEETVEFESGVFNRRKTVLFRKNLILVCQYQTPLDFLFKLSSLRCSGPGGVVTLRYLANKEARSLKGELTAKKQLQPVAEMAVQNETNASH
jgi:membrane protein YdbS with pleckstrin-like domain